MNLKLHIGTPKTGTTYIQYCLYENRARLAESGFYVPTAGSRREEPNPTPCFSHHPLAWAVQEKRELPAPYNHDAFLATRWDAALKEMRESGFEKFIISSEGFFWEVHGEENIGAIREYLLDWDVEIHVVRRDPADYVESLYLQAVKDWSFTGTVLEFLGQYYHHLKFNERMANWRKVFGDKNVRVHTYEDFTFEEYFNQFMSLLGVENPHFPSHPEALAAHNPSIPEEFVDTFRTISKYHLTEVQKTLRDALVSLHLPKAKILSDSERSFINQLLENA